MKTATTLFAWVIINGNPALFVRVINLFNIF